MLLPPETEGVPSTLGLDQILNLLSFMIFSRYAALLSSAHS